MSFETGLGLIGGIASVLGLLVAVVQTMRYRESQRHLHELKRRRNATIWSIISGVLQAYESLEDARDLLKAHNNSLNRELALSKVTSARRSTVNQYVQLLREAVLDEEEFTETTVEEWKRLGRLENEWRVCQAKKFIQPGTLTSKTNGKH